MGKKVVLVGHCGADSSYLRMAVKAADANVQMVVVESDHELKEELMNGADLVLLNRLVDYGFESSEGVEILGMYKKAFPNAKMMLVSNYPEAQADAVKAGALPGFGKREIGTPRVKQLLQQALAGTPSQV